MNKILIADDEFSMLRGIEFHLQENSDYRTLTASDRNTAIQILETNEIDLLVSDLMLPDIEDGLAIMRAAKQQWYQPGVLAMTAYESVENAVAAMQAGADDFVSKGFGLDELSLRIDNMLRKKQQVRQLSIENQILRETIRKQFNDFKIIGESPRMLELMKKAEKVAADARATCMIHGESGTGKDLVARTIHALSVRRNAPFVPINCAAIPENLIESELFGHEKGSFTGAYQTKQGKFEHARGGIIFLDEIGELPLNLQVRLLRVLEERSFYRIGGKDPIDVDVMVLSATNRDLKELVSSGRFREDLYFRLNVVNIEVPALRERREDIRLLAHFFLQKFNQERNKQLKFSENALVQLESHDYPGNVRELRNIIEDAFVFTEGPYIQPENLTFRKPIKDSEGDNGSLYLRISKNFHHLIYKDALDIFDKKYFQQLLEENFWNVSVASRKAEITREWLSKKIKKLGLKEGVN
jgi:DNA-binding NtrC family response regulator